MGFQLKAVQALDLWRGAIVESVRRDGPDLSARQMALLLTVYLTPPPHTVRGLAQTLNVSKPAITRALDRIQRFGDWHTYILRPWRHYLTQHVTTWPEYPDPARSDSHAWSAWLAIDYITTILGVRPLAPGWAGARLSPQTSGLDWARGSAPTPAGPINVEWRRRGSAIDYRAEVPAGLPTEIIVAGRDPLRFPHGGSISVEI